MYCHSTVLEMGGHDLIKWFLTKPTNTLFEGLGEHYFLAACFIGLVQFLSALILYALITQNWKLKNSWVNVFSFALL